ncbi:hypothetical protein [Sulfuriroseicoccus oceanibius]|uniref:Uncharacterized protein n=1 Tax=Sulfuriroseicoccus oceanibius TaxID=2707525 RepID=A0A6B3LAF9_9BACT|nr:hypothetical protein [Sulfuriroseicoccus oceanibius]QQL46201.1 hypothetical protein G3M56_006365 [Sulfuriroseicoccus oceanibius]
MKRLLTLLFAAISIPAISQGDDLPRNWAAPTDGFEWPASPKGAPVFQTKWHKIADLDESIRELATIQIKGSNETPPEQANIAEVDLNGDGKNEIFLRIPRLGGTGGTFFLIFTPEAKGYRVIGQMQVVDVKFVEKKRGWYQIETSSRGGPSDYARMLLTFDKKGYEMTRLENHDLAARTMMIRDLQGEQGDAD